MAPRGEERGAFHVVPVPDHHLLVRELGAGRALATSLRSTWGTNGSVAIDALADGRQTNAA